MYILRNLCRDIYSSRELIYLLVWKDLTSRYRGSALGFFWTVLRPLIYLVIYFTVFSIFMRIKMDFYPIFLFAGLLPWIWFQSSVVLGTQAILNQRGLIKHVHFSPEVLPFVALASTLVNYLLSLPLLFILMFMVGFPIKALTIILPVVIVVQFIFTYGIILALSPLNVYYRDIGHIIESLLPVFLFLTPILYPLTQFPEVYRSIPLREILSWSPLAILQSGYHQALFFGDGFPIARLSYLFGFSIVVLYLGGKVFHHFRDSLAEEV